MSLAQPPHAQARAAVLGSPIGHSLSPVLHRAAYAATGIDWRYDAIECGESALPALLARVRAEPGWRGLSLTMPLKLTAIGLVDTVDANVELVGALNTIVISEQAGGPARLSGHNTDIHGITASIAATGVGEIGSALLLGAGGTARAAIAALAGIGVRRIVVAARDVRRVAVLATLAERLGVDIVPAPWTSLGTELAAAELVISTVPAAATDAVAEVHGWPGGVPLLDVLYEPWPTALAAHAARSGSVVVGGMSVLAHQACEQFVLMTGQPGPLAAMQAAGERALAARAGLAAG